MQTTQGTLVLIDPQKEGNVFWNGKAVPVRHLTVAEGSVFLRLDRGSVDAETIDAMRTAGIKVREVA